MTKGILTPKTVIARFRKKHGDKYDYSKMEYNGGDKEITIICPIHGEFQKKPKHHMAGTGCTECELERRSASLRLPMETCIARLDEKYNGFYDYSKLEYTNVHQYVTVTCPIHGDFDVYLDHHLNRGDKCSKCSNREKSVYNETIFDRNPKLASLPGVFYVIKLSGNDEEFFKVGITKNKVSTRYHQSGTSGYKRTTIVEHSMPLYDAFHLEQFCKRNLNQYVPKIKFDGYTECITDWPYKDVSAVIDLYKDV